MQLSTTFLSLSPEFIHRQTLVALNLSISTSRQNFRELSQASFGHADSEIS